MVKVPDENEKLFYAETKFAMFVIKTNLPFSICDVFSKIVSDMFPDNELAKKYGAGKTKTSQIIKGKRKSKLKNPNCWPTSRKKGVLKFVELILFWSSLQRLGLLQKFKFFKIV